MTFAVQYQLFDTLVKENQDGSLGPGLAESWYISPDGLEILSSLRKDVKFHNGETMTAQDVVSSFERAMASKFTSRITGAMESIELVDDHTVKLKMKYPYGPVIGCIATANMGIVSEKAVTADPEGFARNPVGTGPYKFVKWNTGTKITFEAFEDYYRGPRELTR